jgi:hypothetical protein
LTNMKMRSLAALGPPLLVGGVFVARSENYSILGLTADFWGGCLIGAGLLATAVWLATTISALAQRKQ